MLIGRSDLHFNHSKTFVIFKNRRSNVPLFFFLSTSLSLAGNVSVISLIAVYLIPVFDRDPSVTVAGPMPSLLDRRSNVLAGHVTPLCDSRSSAAIAVP